MFALKMLCMLFDVAVLMMTTMMMMLMMLRRVQKVTYLNVSSMAHDGRIDKQN